MGAAKATPAERIKVAKDFKVELLYTVPRDKQGSWVSLCLAPQGRLIVSDQGGAGLFEITPPPVGGPATDTLWSVWAPALAGKTDTPATENNSRGNSEERTERYPRITKFLPSIRRHRTDPAATDVPIPHGPRRASG